jgi:hypothetical protein
MCTVDLEISPKVIVFHQSMGLVQNTALPARHHTQLASKGTPFCQTSSQSP